MNNTYFFVDSSIDSFSGEYRWLSNFWICPIKTREGKVWPSVEHLYQAYKTKSRSHRREILNCDSASTAKKLGRLVPIRKDWEEVKINIMKQAVYLKFIQNIELRKKLKETGKKELIEGNTWHDNIWGNCTCIKCKKIKGNNYLGKILMEIRNNINDYYLFNDNIIKITL